MRPKIGSKARKPAIVLRISFRRRQLPGRQSILTHAAGFAVANSAFVLKLVAQVKAVLRFLKTATRAWGGRRIAGRNACPSLNARRRPADVIGLSRFRWRCRCQSFRRRKARTVANRASSGGPPVPCGTALISVAPPRNQPWSVSRPARHVPIRL